MIAYFLAIIGPGGEPTWPDRPISANGDFAAKTEVTAYLRGWMDRLPCRSGYTFELSAVGSDERQRVGDGRVTLDQREQPVIEWQNFEYKRFREEPEDYSVGDPHDEGPSDYWLPKPPKPPEID